MDFVMGNLIGHGVSVQVKDGTVWEGILSAGWWQAGVKGVVLKQAKKVVKRDDKAQKPLEEHMIMRDEVVRLSTKGEVNLYNDELTEAARRRGGGIEVDSEIEVSGGRAAFGTERDLVMASAWVGDGDGSLESLSGGGGGGVQRGWDQFAVNKQLGVTSSYSEELYTTKISDKKFSAEQLRRAERLAKEIESGTTTNAHVAEERGQKELEEHDGDMDEEEKYSMVLAPGRSATAGTPDVSDKVAAVPAAAPASAPAADRAPATAPGSESGAPSATATPANRFGNSSKLRAAAKAFVPSFAPASPASGGVMPGATPTGPSPQMIPGAGAYMGSPPQGMSPGVAMGVQPNAMGQMGAYGPNAAMMHGTYMQSPVHPGMMAGYPQHQQQMAMQAQQVQAAQQQQQYAAQHAAQQQQQQQQQQYAAAQAAQVRVRCPNPSSRSWRSPR
jgi:hypothetical protein